MPTGHNGAICPHCGEWIIEASDLAKIDFTCPVCERFIYYDAHQCIECGLQLTDAFWRITVQDYFDRTPVAPAPVNPKLITLCCDEPGDLCECDIQVTWSDLAEVPSQVDEEAYEARAGEGECPECIHYFEPTCPSFRNWMKDYLIEGVIGLRIDGCSEYVHYLDDPYLREDYSGA